MQQPNDVHPPWYRQFWPWVIIAIPLSAVIMGAVTLWLALANPEYLVVEDEEYDRLRREMRAQDMPTDQAPAPEPGDREQP